MLTVSAIIRRVAPGRKPSRPVGAFILNHGAPRALLSAALLGILPFQQQRGGHVEQPGFVAAFRVSQECAFNLLWPLPDMPPAPYERVLVVIRAMPFWRHPSDQDDRWVPMPASKHLRMNGRMYTSDPVLRKAAGAGDAGEAFVVDLVRGRIHFTLRIPDGYALHPVRKSVEVTLYELAPP